MERRTRNAGYFILFSVGAKYPGCQGHSHPKLSVVQGAGSKPSADEIQPTARRYPNYGQYSGVVHRPLNNEGQVCVKPSSVRT